MAARWSSETVVAEYRDLQANAMGVDSTGKHAVLAGRRCLAIIDLDRPEEPIKKCSRQSKWEVTTAEWNPTPEKQNMFAIACNQRAELQVCRDSDVVVQHSLRAHTRVISDLNWSPFDPNLIATCSVDTFIHLWDVRDCRRPVASLCAVAGASQVKWNKAHTNLLATSHDGDVRLWDNRKSNIPFQYIAAHLSKIHGLDWSRVQGQEFLLATSSQDCTVKFWDVAEPCLTHHVLASGSPVWRARYTPFGEGLVTVVVPQLRRGENSLLLWSASKALTHVHTFVGHTDVVLEFEWREHCDEAKDYQLVTWSKDQSLRIWRIDSHLQKLCGHDVDLIDDIDQMTGETVESLELNLMNAHNSNNGALRRLDETEFPVQEADSKDDVKTPVDSVPAALPIEDGVDALPLSAASVSTAAATAQATSATNGKRSDDGADVESGKSELLSPLHPKNLQHEFMLLNQHIPNVRVEDMDSNARTCMVSAASGKQKVRLTLTFPNSYPFNAPPTFQFCKGTTVSSNMKNELTKVLRRVCQQHVKKNMSCLEPCLRQLITTLDAFSLAEKESLDVNGPFNMEPNPQAFLPPPKMYGSYQDSNVPFPKTCGASFCGAGFLVCFARPAQPKSLSNATDLTPRSLSVLAAYASNPMQAIGRPGQTTPPFNFMYPPVAQSPTGDPGVSIMSFYYQDRRQRNRGKLRRDDGSSRFPKLSVIDVYDISRLLPISKELAQVYRLDRDIPSLCSANMAAAMSIGRKDLVQLWSLAALSASPHLKPSSDPNTGPPWARHPFGRQMLQSLIEYYLKLGDVQSVAVLCCIFNPNVDQEQTASSSSSSSSSASTSKKPCSVQDVVTYPLSGKWWLKAGGSPYHTIHPGDTVMDGYSLGTLLKNNRSNSWSDCLDDCDSRPFCLLSFEANNAFEREKHESNVKLLDTKKILLYDQVKRAYADILYQWNLLNARAQVLKYMFTPPEHHIGVEFLNECIHCHRDVRGPQCATCKNYCFQCSICHVSVKGSFNVCFMCGHGGHAAHLLEWFSLHDFCPQGCGCFCLWECPSSDS